MTPKIPRLAAVKSFTRQLIERNTEGCLVQDFYVTGEKRTDPFLVIAEESAIPVSFDYELLPIDGLLTLYYKTGVKEQQVNYQAGKRNGEWSSWYVHGQKAGEGYF